MEKSIGKQNLGRPGKEVDGGGKSCGIETTCPFILSDSVIVGHFQ